MKLQINGVGEGDKGSPKLWQLTVLPLGRRVGRRCVTQQHKKFVLKHSKLIVPCCNALLLCQNAFRSHVDTDYNTAGLIGVRRGLAVDMGLPTKHARPPLPVSACALLLLQANLAWLPFVIGPLVG